jgi:hypothetical protein
LGSKSGRLASATISPVWTSIITADAPCAFKSAMPPARTSSTVACTVRSSDRASGWVWPGSRRSVVELRLDACNPDHLGGVHRLLPEARTTQHMGRDGPVWIKPHLARTEQQARFPQIMHRLFLLGLTGSASTTGTAAPR